MMLFRIKYSRLYDSVSKLPDNRHRNTIADKFHPSRPRCGKDEIGGKSLNSASLFFCYLTVCLFLVHIVQEILFVLLGGVARNFNRRYIIISVACHHCRIDGGRRKENPINAIQPSADSAMFEIVPAFNTTCNSFFNHSLKNKVRIYLLYLEFSLDK